MTIADVEKAFARFEFEASRARRTPERRGEMSNLLKEALEVAGKSKHDIWNKARIANRTSVQRWLSGKTVPHSSTITRLGEYLTSSDDQTGIRSMIPFLLDRRYLPILEVIVLKHSAGVSFTEDQLLDLLWLAARSRGILSVDAVRSFIGE